MARKGKKRQEHGLIAALVAIGFAFLIILMAFRIGFIGILLDNAFRYVFGSLRIWFTIFVGFWLAILFFNRKVSANFIKVNIAIGMVFISLFIILSLLMQGDAVGFDAVPAFIKDQQTIQLSLNGGLLGVLLYALVSQLFETTGTWIFAIGILVAAFVVVFYHKIPDATRKGAHAAQQRYYRWQRDRNDQKMAKQHEAAIAQAHLEAQAQAKPVEPTPPVVKDETTEVLPAEGEDSSSPRRVQAERVNRVFRLPNVNLLKSQGFTTANTNNISYANENAKKLLQILETFSIKATLSEIHVGPAVTKYELKPELGVKVNRIAALQNDIKMALAAKDIRIEAPIPGKSAVGIEIPNPEKTMVFMKDLLKQVPPKYNDSKLFFALGKNLLGDNIYGELNKMPHLLIAGATGSGKSVCVNAIITSILMRAKPEEVQMLLIDPKKVEFTPYKDIPHLIGPVITDPKDASNALKVIVAMMDERYDVFAKVGVRNLDAYKALLASGEDHLPAMPQIVVIVDELADLMLVASKEVEASIQRITQLARAAGIHLIVATQRPSVDVITGVIKANIPSRIAFAVSSAVDSRTILDQVGAEKLLGFGDMLYLPIGENVVQRVQGVYVSDAEVQAVCDWVKQQGSPKYHDAFAMLEMHGSQSAGNAAGMSQSDVLYDEVKRYVVESQKASTSLIQRRFAIGYARAARLMDLLEQNGVIGPSRGSKPREVYVSVNE